MKRTIICGALFVAAALPTVAVAGQSERVAIGSFQGPQANRIQGAVETGLMTRYYVVPDFSVAAEAKRQGVNLREDGEFGTVGRALDVRAFVSAEVEKRAGWRVQLTVRRGDTGAAIGQFVLANRRLDKLESQLTTGASGRLRSLLARTPRGEGAPAPAVEPRAEAQVAASAPEEEPEETSTDEAAVTLVAGGRMFSRSFSYTQNLSELPAYRLSQALATELALSLRPARMISLPPGLRPLRLSGMFQYGMGIESHVSGTEASQPTKVMGWQAGLGYQLGSSALGVVPQLVYAVHSFSTGAEPTAAAPDVRYRLMGGGADGRWEPARGLAVLVRAAYLRALSLGALASAERFPHATADGVEVEGAVAFVFTPAVELRASAGVRRIGFAMHSEPGDRWVAGGAIDQTTWVGLGLAYRR
jgi:hypothetical protein